MKIRYLLITVLLPFTVMAGDYNAIILEQVKTMPAGGGYSVSSSASSNLRSAVADKGGELQIDAAKAEPSYCSGATYLVFLKTLRALQQKGDITLTPETVSALLVRGQRDGEGIWGRWNANGPGTARLFEELKLGKNFTSYAQAEPGDFMKIFWKDAVGKRESGHLVVFQRLERREGKDFVHFWSSNIPGGYGEKVVPASRIARVIFSRLENPQNINHAARLPAKDDYLASLLIRESSFAEAKQKANVQ